MEELDEDENDFDPKIIMEIFALHYSPYLGKLHKNTKSHSKSPRQLMPTNNSDSDEEESDEANILTPRRSDSRLNRVIKKGKYNVASLDDKRRVAQQKAADYIGDLRKKFSNVVKGNNNNDTEGASPRRDGGGSSIGKPKILDYHELIEDSGIYLGVQPTSSVGSPFLVGDYNSGYELNTDLFLDDDYDLETICGYVFTIQESYEMGGSIVNNNPLNRPITHNIFAKLGIGNIWMQMVDHSPDVNYEMALYRLYDVMEAFLNNLPTYMHCKSGKGRSGMFEILLFSFCFLLYHYHTNHKNAKSSFMPEVDEAEREIIRGKQISRLLVVINAVNNTKLEEKLKACEKPDEELLKSLVDACEKYIKTKRKIKIDEKRKTALVILKILVERLYGEKNTAHSKAKSSNMAFLDDLGQTRVYKDICIYMGGRPNVKRCESFQYFLYRMLKNEKGWYRELTNAVEETDFVEGWCNHFAQAESIKEGITHGARKADQEKRLKFVEVFKEEIDKLATKYPDSVYGITCNGKVKDISPIPISPIKNLGLKRRPLSVVSKKDLRFSGKNNHRLSWSTGTMPDGSYLRRKKLMSLETSDRNSRVSSGKIEVVETLFTLDQSSSDSDKYEEKPNTNLKKNLPNTNDEDSEEFYSSGAKQFF